MADEEVPEMTESPNAGVIIAVGPEGDEVPCTEDYFEEFLKPLNYSLKS